MDKFPLCTMRTRRGDGALAWDEIVGHQAVKQYLQRSVAMGRVAHAYALVGPQGVGKSLVARAMAQALLCPRTQHGAPCGECRACRQVRRLHHPDFHLVEDSDGTIGIDRVRELQRELSLKPYEAERKVAVIDQADRLTDAAQNSLLKTLEEPPGDTVLFLIAANPNALLSTVRSRCYVLRFQPLAAGDIEKWLIARGVGDQEAKLAAALSGGSLRAALAAVERDYVAMRERVAGWIGALADKMTGLRSVLLIGEELEAQRERVDEYLNLFFLWLRDLLLLLEGVTAGIANQDAIERLENQAKVLSPEGLSQALYEVDRARKSLRANANFRLTVDVMLANVQRSLVS